MTKTKKIRIGNRLVECRPLTTGDILKGARQGDVFQSGDDAFRGYKKIFTHNVREGQSQIYRPLKHKSSAKPKPEKVRAVPRLLEVYGSMKVRAGDLWELTAMWIASRKDGGAYSGCPADNIEKLHPDAGRLFRLVLTPRKRRK